MLRHLVDQLAGLGLEVEQGVGGMATAFRRGPPRRQFRPQSRSEFHCTTRCPPCAPRPRRAGAARAGMGRYPGASSPRPPRLTDLRDQLAGEVVVLGCPADEIHAPGRSAQVKARLCRSGGSLEGIDAALYAHPEFVDTVSLESLWMRRDRVRVFGSRSLSGAEQTPLLIASAADRRRPPRAR